MPATVPRLPSAKSTDRAARARDLPLVRAPPIMPHAGGVDAPLYKQLAGDFSCVAELKSRYVEGERDGFICAASTDLAEHFDILRPDFAGLPLLCFAHAQLVVCLRRRLELAENLPVFLRLWAEEHEFLTTHLNSRWLISACDSFVDYGSDAQKAAAMALVILINTVKLAETERFASRDPLPLREKFDGIAERHAAKRHIELWDGITAYAPYTGDMPRNMLRRLATLTERDPALTSIARTLIRRAVAADTLLGRLARLNPGFLPVEFA